MERSDSIKDLATALSKAQAEFKPANRGGRNPYFNQAKYATLEEIVDVIREQFGRNGLSYVQEVVLVETQLFLKTTILHISGEWISGAIPMLLEKQNMQGIGSAITYGKRYGLAALAGVVSDADDDGNDSVIPPSQQKKEQPKVEKSKSEKLVQRVLPRPADLGDYIIPIGKIHKGKRLKDVDAAEIANFLQWLEEQPEKPDLLTQDFINTASEYLDKLSSIEDDDDDEIAKKVDREMKKL